MRKFLTNEGKEIQFGDLVEWAITKNSDGLYCESYYATNLTEENVDKLLEAGIIVEKILKEDTETFGLEYFAKTLDDICKEAKSCNAELIAEISKKYPGAVMHIFLMKLAKTFNKNRGLNPKFNEYVFAVSLLNGIIVRIKTSHIKNWSYVAAFCCKEDAEKAVKLLKL